MLPCPGVTPGSVGSAAADVFAALEFEVCCSLPWPTPLPGLASGSTSSVIADAFSEADCEGGDESLWSAL